MCDLQDEYLSELFKATSGGHADHKSLCLKYVAHFEFYIKRNKRMHVSGVGFDPAACNAEAIVPIAIKSPGDIGTTKDQHRANMADGCGVDDGT